MSTYTKNKDMPSDFTEDTVNAINRIEQNKSVLGVLYFRNDIIRMYTIPEPMAIMLAKSLPRFTAAVHRAVSEIDALDEMVVFRIETKSIEIIVTSGSDFVAGVVHAVKKGKPKKSTKKSLKQ